VNSQEWMHQIECTKINATKWMHSMIMHPGECKWVTSLNLKRMQLSEYNKVNSQSECNQINAPKLIHLSECYWVNAPNECTNVNATKWMHPSECISVNSYKRMHLSKYTQDHAPKWTNLFRCIQVNAKQVNAPKLMHQNERPKVNYTNKCT
jgi:hypothetical protein